MYDYTSDLILAGSLLLGARKYVLQTLRWTSSLRNIIT